MPQTTLLVVLDGWGHSEESRGNAIAAAETPVWDRLWRDAPHTLISCSGTDVGLPSGQMGNSEVGHMNIGAGRVVHQDFTRITEAIESGAFEKNPVLHRAIETALSTQRPVHIMGLLSPGGVHSFEDHIHAAVRLAAKHGSRVYVHAFLDGRDTPPRSAEASIERMDALLDELGPPGVRQPDCRQPSVCTRRGGLRGALCRRGGDGRDRRSPHDHAVRPGRAGSVCGLERLRIVVGAAVDHRITRPTRLRGGWSGADRRPMIRRW